VEPPERSSGALAGSKQDIEVVSDKGFASVFGACTKRRIMYRHHQLVLRKRFPMSRCRSAISLGVVLTTSLLLVVSLWWPLKAPDVQTMGSSAIHSPHFATSHYGSNCGTLKGEVPSSIGRLSVLMGTCVFNMTASLTRNTTGSNPATRYNLSSSLDGIAEISSGGSVVQYSNLSGNSTQVMSIVVNRSGGYSRLGFEAAVNVTSASGSWTPSAILGGEVKQDGPVIGTVVVQLVFVLQISPANTSALKFDVGVSGWPWVGSTDHLGLVFGTVAELGAHLVWERGSQNLTEALNSGGGPFAGLRLGQFANTSGSGGGASTVNVSSDAGFYSVGTPSRGAYLLVNFTGVNEEYASLHYDPWIIFAVPVVPSGASALFDWGIVVAIVAGSAAAMLLGVAGFRARRIAPEAEMRSMA